MIRHDGMVGQDYLKLQNQGSVMSNIRLLHEMELATEYADSQGYYTKRSVAEIGVNSLLITSGSKVGESARAIVNADDDESRNSPLQNAKARMQLLRVLGMVSADYGSEVYAITRLGKLMVSQVLRNNPDYSLLRELFVGMTTATENYEHNCHEGFNCCLGFGICYALANLDYRLSSDEMPLLTTYDIREIDEFVREARENRKHGLRFTTRHPHFPKTKKNEPLKQVSNLTRTVNQIMRLCGIIEQRQVRIGNVNYYVCTADGRRYVDGIKSRYASHKFVTAWDFRKINNIALQKELCGKAYAALLYRSGIDKTQNDFDKEFSPFQVLPETSAEWFLGGHIRRHPDVESDRMCVIENESVARELRVDAVYEQARGDMTLETEASRCVRDMIKTRAASGDSVETIATDLCSKYRDADKDAFYPLVHALLNIIGLKCEGEIGRYDAYCLFNGCVIPVEIKSFTESPSYNMKGIRQAIENKIMSYDRANARSMDYASLVIGFSHPGNDAAIRRTIDMAYRNFGIKIIACDLCSITRMAVRRVVSNEVLDFESVLTGYGLLID